MCEHEHHHHNHSHCHCHHGHCHNHVENANRTLAIIIITIVTMFAEVLYGFLTNSMALLSDGWHMGTHALALAITYVAYVFINKIKNHEHAGTVSEKITSLAGFTSSLFLLITAVWIIFESATRFVKPLEISFNEAILVAIIGFVVNVVCIFIMEFKNDKDNKDYNYKAAYLHILTDVMTSIFAIAALLTGKYLGWVLLDPIIGILGGVLILRWSVQLIKDTTTVLLDLKLLKA